MRKASVRHGGREVTDINALREIQKTVDAAAREYHDYLANAPEPFRDSPQLRRERDRLEGFFQQRLVDAFPALASELEAARKVVAAAQARHGAWWRWVMAKGPTAPEWIELDRLTVDEKDALREYLRVMEGMK